MKGVQCLDCWSKSKDPNATLPDDFICKHFQPEYWVNQGFVRNWGDAAVNNFPHLEILRREIRRGEVEFVILAPYATRRPVILSHGWGIY